MTKPESRRKPASREPFDQMQERPAPPAETAPAPAMAAMPRALVDAIAAAQDKKASDLVLLDLRESGAFTDFFLLCSGQNARQVKAIVDAIEERLRKAGARPAHIEGYDRAEWVLLDCFDFVIHVFTPDCRRFYALERLWGSAQRVELEDPAVADGPQARAGTADRRTRRE
jgi:ribosome-associated protein